MDEKASPDSNSNSIAGFGKVVGWNTCVPVMSTVEDGFCNQIEPLGVGLGLGLDAVEDGF